MTHETPAATVDTTCTMDGRRLLAWVELRIDVADAYALLRVLDHGRHTMNPLDDDLTYERQVICTSLRAAIAEAVASVQPPAAEPAPSIWRQTMVDTKSRVTDERG